MAWLSGYGYRRQITITGQSGAGTDFPVILKVGETSGATGEDFDVGGHCSAFPNDIRFTDNDGETILYPTLESISGTSPNRTATIHVRVNDNLGTNQTIYCYYGKSDALSSWDMANTFPALGENFNAYKNYFDNWILWYGVSTDFMGPYSVYNSGQDRTYQVLYGPDGDIYVTYFDHSKNTWVDRVFVHTDPAGGDSYSSPTLCRSSAGYLNIFYGQTTVDNQACPIYQSRSTNTDDISAWTYKGAITNPLTDEGYECVNPVLAANGDIYLFSMHIYNVGAVDTTADIVFQKSTDGGDTWGSEVAIIDGTIGGGDDRCWIWAGGNFWRVGNRIPISWIYYVKYSAPNPYYDGVYYAYFDTSDGHLYSVNGTDLGTKIMRSEADAYCRAVTINEELVRFSRVRLDSSNNPYIIYLHDNGSTVKYYLVYWTGSAWSSPQEITTSSSFMGNTCDFEVLSSTSIKCYLGAADDDIEQWDWNGSSWSKIQTVANAADYGDDLGFPLIPLDYNPEFKLTFSQTGVDNYQKGFAWGSLGFLGDYVGYTTDTELRTVWVGGQVERTTVWEGRRCFYHNGGAPVPYKDFTISGDFVLKGTIRFSEAGDKLNLIISDSSTRYAAYIDSGYPASGYWGYFSNSSWINSGVANSINTWYYIKVTVDVAGKKYTASVSTNGEDWTTIANDVAWGNSASSANRFFPREYASFYDFVRIYQYVAIEPSFSSAGSEERENFQLSITESISAGDTPTKSMLAGLSLTEGFKSGSTNSPFGMLSSVDGLKAGDSLSILASLLASDGFKLGDTTSYNVLWSLIIAEGIKLGDSNIINLTLPLIVTDGVKLGEALSILTKLAISDGLKPGDSASTEMLATLLYSDGVKLGDLTTLEEAILYLIALEGLKAGDSCLGGMLANTQTSDGIKAGDSTLLEVLANLLLADGLKVGDSVSRLANMLPTIADGLEIGDSGLVGMLASLSATSGLKLGDATDILTELVYLSITQGVKIGDSPVLAMLASLSLAEAVKAGDTRAIAGISKALLIWLFAQPYFDVSMEAKPYYDVLVKTRIGGE